MKHKPRFLTILLFLLLSGTIINSCNRDIFVASQDLSIKILYPLDCDYVDYPPNDCTVSGKITIVGEVYEPVPWTIHHIKFIIDYTNVRSIQNVPYPTPPPWTFQCTWDTTTVNDDYHYITLGVYNDRDIQIDFDTIMVYVDNGVQNQPPVANAGPDRSATAGEEIQFDGSNSYDPDGTIVSYLWNFDDGETSNEIAPTHTYYSEGTYYVTLTVTDNNGASDSDTARVFVSSGGGNHFPTACFDYIPPNPEVGQIVDFDASCSFDLDSDPLSYFWDFGDGYSDNGERVSHSYSSSGAYEVTLIVDDGKGGTNSASKTVYVGQAPPQVDLSIIEVKPIQVLEEFLGDPDYDFFENAKYDLIAGKSTAVKVTVVSTGKIENVGVKVNFNGKMIEYFFIRESNCPDFRIKSWSKGSYLSFKNAGAKCLYFFPNNTPNVSGPNYLSAEIYNVVDINPSNNFLQNNNIVIHQSFWCQYEYCEDEPYLKIKYFPVNLDTTEFELFKKRIDEDRNEYDRDTDGDVNEFIKSVLPISNSWLKSSRAGYVIYIRDFENIFGKSLPWPISGNLFLMDTFVRIMLASYSEQGIDRYIAVIPPDYSYNVLGAPLNTGGFTHPAISSMAVVELRDELPAIVAHELGHTYWLYPFNEKNDLTLDPTVSWKIWQERMMYMDKCGYVYSFMHSSYMGYTDWQDSVWVDHEDYENLFKKHAFPSLTAFPFNSPVDYYEQYDSSILITGFIDRNDNVNLSNWFKMDTSPWIDSIEEGDYSIQLLDSSGNQIFVKKFPVSFDLSFLGSQPPEIDYSPFAFLIPYVAGTKKIIVKHNDKVLAERVVSNNSPIANVIYPNGGEIVRGTVKIQWNATDADRDDLSYAVLFSSDGGKTWNTLEIDLKENYYIWNTSKLEEGDEYMVKVIATDSINTGIDVSDSVFSVIKSISQSADYLIDKNKMMKPLASTRISQAESLEERAYSLIREVVGKDLDVSEAQTLIEKADKLLADAKEQYLFGNYIAANTLALEAIDLYQQVIEILENLLE